MTPDSARAWLLPRTLIPLLALSGCSDDSAGSPLETDAGTSETSASTTESSEAGQETSTDSSGAEVEPERIDAQRVAAAGLLPGRLVVRLRRAASRSSQPGTKRVISRTRSKVPETEW